ncbi:hypothetical protein [Paenibacillus sp. 19GGS1-52]|nr:hypothetical protein [Paenibacillus sp. 19GGS1-52]
MRQLPVRHQPPYPTKNDPMVSALTVKNFALLLVSALSPVTF